MKRDKQIRMLLHPEQYTDEQLDQMLHEQDIPVPDAEEEWRRFQAAHTSVRRRRLRAAAMFIGVLMLSGIAYAAVQLWSPANTQHPAPSTQHPCSEACAGVPTTKMEIEYAEQSADKIYTFENTPLDRLAKELADYYNKVADIRNAEASEVRIYYQWNLTDSLETVVADLNHFDRVNLTIENDKLIVNP